MSVVTLSVFYRSGPKFLKFLSKILGRFHILERKNLRKYLGKHYFDFENKLVKYM